MLTDPIADMIARIRNGLMRSKAFVIMPYSKIKMNIAEVLLREGYIRSVEKQDAEDGIKHTIKIFLKYYNGTSVIRNVRRISKPSLHRYVAVKNIKPVANGLGISILTTPCGIVSDREAKEKKVGGKILISVY